MTIHEIFTTLLISSVGAILPLAFWVAVIVFARIMLKRGGGRAERFLITGASLNLSAVVLRIPTSIIVPALALSNQLVDIISTINTVSTAIRITTDIIDMAGIICIIYAFWVKFNNKKAVPTA
ncbi:hypothetical protein ACFLYN_01350 [Chloroflexota bacterium]